MSTEAHFSGSVPSSAGARSWRQRPLGTDNVNHLGRRTTIILADLMGMIVVGSWFMSWLR